MARLLPSITLCFLLSLAVNQSSATTFHATLDEQMNLTRHASFTNAASTASIATSGSSSSAAVLVTRDEFEQMAAQLTELRLHVQLQEKAFDAKLAAGLADLRARMLLQDQAVAAEQDHIKQRLDISLNEGALRDGSADRQSQSQPEFETENLSETQSQQSVDPLEAATGASRRLLAAPLCTSTSLCIELLANDALMTMGAGGDAQVYRDSASTVGISQNLVVPGRVTAGSFYGDGTNLVLTNNAIIQYLLARSTASPTSITPAPTRNPTAPPTRVPTALPTRNPTAPPTRTPTPQPTMGNAMFGGNWYLAAETQTCTQFCSARGGSCVQAALNSLTTEATAISVFGTALKLACTYYPYAVATFAWMPAYHPNGYCYYTTSANTCTRISPSAAGYPGYRPACPCNN